MANIVVTYILWLCGGMFGLHHFYLGRDRHALVWWSSCGGFVLGWFRDLWRLPEYVCIANNDLRYVREYASRRLYSGRPKFSVIRFAGQIFIGSLFGYLLRLCIPEELFKAWAESGNILAICLAVIGCTIGVHLVGNIGECKLAFKHALLGACIALPGLISNNELIYLAALSSAIFSTKKIQWKIEHVRPNRRGCCNVIKRATILTVCGLLYLSMWTSALYLNVKIHHKDGEEVPLREAVQNFFKSSAWQDMKNTTRATFDFCQNKAGWWECWSQLKEKMDPTGEVHAFKVLELDGSPTLQEIQSRCRQLKKQYHPDKQKTDEAKKTAELKFMEVSEACQILDKIKQRRAKKNMQSHGTPTVDVNEEL